MSERCDKVESRTLVVRVVWFPSRSVTLTRIKRTNILYLPSGPDAPLGSAHHSDAASVRLAKDEHRVSLRRIRITGSHLGASERNPRLPRGRGRTEGAPRRFHVALPENPSHDRPAFGCELNDVVEVRRSEAKVLAARTRGRHVDETADASVTPLSDGPVKEPSERRLIVVRAKLCQRADFERALTVRDRDLIGRPLCGDADRSRQEFHAIRRVFYVLLKWRSCVCQTHTSLLRDLLLNRSRQIIGFENLLRC